MKLVETGGLSYNVGFFPSLPDKFSKIYSFFFVFIVLLVDSSQTNFWNDTHTNLRSFSRSLNMKQIKKAAKNAARSEFKSDAREHLKFNLLQWKEFLSGNNKTEVIMQEWGGMDGFGHRLQRLYSGVSTILVLNPENFSFLGYNEIISQDVAYFNSRSYPNKKVYCHSVQEWELNKRLFRELRSMLPKNDQYSPTLTYEIIKKRSNKKNVQAWIQSLRCEFLDLNSFHTIKRATSEVSSEPQCLLDPNVNPFRVAGIEQCKNFLFYMKWVDFTASIRSDSSDQKAKTYLKFEQNDRVRSCGYKEDTLNIAVHFRMGDAILSNSKQILLSFQQTIDSVVMLFSRPSIPDVKMKIHIFTELSSPCPPGNGKSKEFQTLNFQRSNCSCQAPALCPEYDFEESCQEKCTPYFEASHRFKNKLQFVNDFTKSAQTKFNVDVCGQSCLDVPVIFHSGRDGMLNDFLCLQSSEVLVLGCSYFSTFAALFAKGVIIDQKCTGGVQTGHLEYPKNLQDSELWRSMFERWQNKSSLGGHS